MSNATAAVAQKKSSGLLGRLIRRFFLCLFTFLLLTAGALGLTLNLVFNGPSPAARDLLTASLTEHSATEWIPGMFLDPAVVEEIASGA